MAIYNRFWNTNVGLLVDKKLINVRSCCNMGVIKSLFEKWACKHEWAKWDVVNVRDDFGGRYTVTHFTCKKCGKFKKVKSF